jgi:hypothetical protein
MSDEAYAWEQHLLEAVEPLGPARAADFTTLTPYRPEELEHLNKLVQVPEFSSYHAEAMSEHTVRMYRLDKLLQDLSLEKPRAPSGRKSIDDDDIVKGAQTIMAKQKKQNKKAALEEALYNMDPPLAPEEYVRAFDRIYKNKI